MLNGFSRRPEKPRKNNKLLKYKIFLSYGIQTDPSERIEAVVPERSPEEITAELEEKLTSLLGTPITLG